MCGGTIIGHTASTVPGRNRLSTPNGLSSLRSKKISHWGAVVPPSENLQMQTPPATGFLILMAYLDVVSIVPAGRYVRLTLCASNTSGILNSTAK